MTQDTTKAVLESLLFVSEGPLTLEQMKNVLDTLETNEIRAMLIDLQNEYEASNRGLRIVEVAGGFQVVTPPALSPFIKKLYKQRKVERLSKPALETLAIIAYKQPVTRLEIESIRNVNIDGMVSSLMEKEFIRVTGVKKAPGLPKVYGTTKQFLEYFGLRSLEELPKLEDFTQLAQQKIAEDEARNKADEATHEEKQNESEKTAAAN